MTTIILKDKTLYADTQISFGISGKALGKDKTLRSNLRESWLGFAGSYSLTKGFLAVIEDQSINGTVIPEMFKEIHAVELTDSGKYYYHRVEEGLFTSSDLENYDTHYAIGSGSDYALGALGAGASIEEVYRIVNSHDIYTGVDFISRSANKRSRFNLC